MSYIVAVNVGLTSEPIIKNVEAISFDEAVGKALSEIHFLNDKTKGRSISGWSVLQKPEEKEETI